MDSRFKKAIRIAKVLKWVAENPKTAFTIIEDHLTKEKAKVIFNNILEHRRWDVN